MTEVELPDVEHCVFFEGQWIAPDWIGSEETQKPDFNPNGYTPAMVQGIVRLFSREHVRRIAPDQEQLMTDRLAKTTCPCAQVLTRRMGNE